MFKLTPERLRRALEASVIVLCLLLVAFVLFDIGPSERQRRAQGDDAAKRFDRICTSVRAPLTLALQRVRTVGTVEAGRDIAVVIAPVVGQCTGMDVYQGRLEGLATSNDAARDARVIQGILDEIAKVARP